MTGSTLEDCDVTALLTPTPCDLCVGGEESDDDGETTLLDVVDLSEAGNGDGLAACFDCRLEDTGNTLITQSKRIYNMCKNKVEY